MAREIGKLSAVGVRNQSKPGLYNDGGGLYLQVTESGAKTWIYRFMLAGRRRDMGLGSLNTVSLADARDEARSYRQNVRNGLDPIEIRKARKLAAEAEASKAMTFKQCAELYIKAHESEWRNSKHAAQWTSSLTTYAYPAIGNVSVAAVDTPLIMKVLEPIWTIKTETASRVRGRVETILDWARVRKYRSGENPALWKGHLDHLLPARGKVQKAGHHAALPYDQMGTFMKALRNEDGVSARALEFAILTIARTGEVIGAKWQEIDFKKAIWIIPPERMKAGKEHRIPLVKSAVALLRSMEKLKTGDFVFPGGKSKKPLSNMALLVNLRRMKRNDATVHGFRSTFRDWAAEQTDFPSELAEMALAHTVSDKVEAAYRRGDMFDKRIKLMEAWARFCETPSLAA